MVEAAIVARLVGGVVLLFANGFFVTTEFAMTRVRQFDAADFQGAGLERAWEMTERLEIFLSGCQVGITVSSVGLGVIAEPAVAALLDPVVRWMGVGSPGATGHTALSVVLALAIINLLHVIIGEQAPTYLGVERTKFVAKYGAPALYWWTRLMWPVIAVADRIAKALLGVFGVEMTRSWTEAELEDPESSSRAELRRAMGETLAQAGLSTERREEVISALDIGRIPVESVMVDRAEVVALRADSSTDEIIERVRARPHARYPLIESSLEEYLGVIYAPSLVELLDDPPPDIRELATEPITVDAETSVSDVIDRFQAANEELALVRREDEIVGLVTATDCFEAITGELEDPMDVQTILE